MKNSATVVSREILYQLGLVLKRSNPLVYGGKSVLLIGEMFFYGGTRIINVHGPPKPGKCIN